MLVKLFSDGACSGNGTAEKCPGGYGTILQAYKDNVMLSEREYSQGYIDTTNNRMELRGVIRGLEELTKPCDLEIVSDSKYVIDAFNKNWIDGWVKNGWKNSQKSPVKNRDLWERLLVLLKPHNVLRFTWVKGHQDHEENKRCDKMAVAAYNGDNLIPDEGYEH